MEHGLKYIAFYVTKTYNTLHSCHNFPAGSRQAAVGARICEMSLLQACLCVPCAVKILERPMYNRLILYINRYGLLYEYQVWF